MLQGIIDEAGSHDRKPEIAMGKPRLTLAIMMFVLACGPEAREENDIPGTLEYEQLYSRVYRLDRRIDVRFETENGERWECGFLTDRAYDDLEGTLAALDPSGDYGYDPDILDCERSDALVYIEGFEHSPFECSYDCCHPDLHWAAAVYTMILTNFHGGYPVIEGEPYVAIEPDQPCPAEA
jgi:hypothetical protein